MKLLVVGLGNPGKQYAHNRHNLGFRVVDEFSRSTGAPFAEKKSWQAMVAETTLRRKRILLIKPLTFMNNSGAAVKKIRDYYKIPNQAIIVVHDDVDLPLGDQLGPNIRWEYDTSETGSAGHLGVESVIAALGGKNFTRLRIGINRRRSRNQPPTEQYVLENFTPSEATELKAIILPKVIEELIKFIKQIL